MLVIDDLENRILSMQKTQVLAFHYKNLYHGF